MTPGQRRAVAELRMVERRGAGAVSIRSEPTESDEYVKVPITVSTAGTRHYPGGLRLRPTEDLEVWIPPDAPLRPPHLFAADARWATNAHVTGTSVCLYIDPATQWSPADGMFGFVHRMGEWFVAAAAGELDPANGPLHPPVALGIGYSKADLVILADVPESEHRRLLWANLEPRGHNRLDVTAFHRCAPKAADRMAAVVLTKRPLVGDYARTYGALSLQLEQLGFTRNSLTKHLIETAPQNPEGTPLIVLVGTPNRRVDGQRFHHLVGWELPASLADRLRTLVTTASEKEVEETLVVANEWAATEPLLWTGLYEAREAVTRRRDARAAASNLTGKTIEIWGCGALGGWLADFVARAEPSTLRLRDRSTVGPGLLVRQPYDDADVTRPKAAALADRLRQIHDGKVDVHGWVGDVTKLETIDDEVASADLIIDATANRSVAAAIDRYAAANTEHPLIISVATDARCERTAAFSSPPGTAGPGYTARSAALELAKARGQQDLIDAFWGSHGYDDLVQPEPGCSAPTFHGSAADAASAAATLTNQIADCSAQPNERTAVFTHLPHCPAPQGTSPLVIGAASPLRIESNEEYVVLLRRDAHDTIERLAAQTFESETPVETGGLLFGERDDAALTVTVDVATGPPPDSAQSPLGFERGTDGNDEAVAALAGRADGVSYLGDWHTHPNGAGRLSATDRAATKDRIDGASLILIWVGAPGEAKWAAHVFDSESEGPALPSQPERVSDPAPVVLPAGRPNPKRRAALGPCLAPMPPRRPLPPTRPSRPAILVALSGGGFRATLAGLGVLRFLVDADLTDDTRIISSVSGGSLANAAIAQNWDKSRRQPFFDELVLRPMVEAISGRSFRADLLRNSWRALRPGSSRTTVLADRLAKRLLGDHLLEDLPTGCWFMFNAANVTEGVRFRFDADVVGDYVSGSIPTEGSGLRVATAVAGSAAVPGPFPPLALDHLEFPCSEGRPVRIADGGVYDNLGLEAIQRQRHEFESSFLLSLNAGSLLPADARSGFGRLPIAGKLWRANAVMHRQIGGLRTRRLFQESASGEGRPFVVFNLATEFGDDLDADEWERLDAWRDINEEHDETAREALAAIPTTFARIGRADALALVQRGWWLTGAILTVRHPWLLRSTPRWRDPGLI